ncbi:carboxypeptidase regulatory-like domain-containing protein [Nocardia callitridis]|uniref:Integral membrane bound transporter domain-containing protein n=1 Tax=Nocardia callitridis TaxID=648753 RepID=A0ABP9KT93_9NOCA
MFGSGGNCPTCRPAWPIRVRDHMQATDPTLARLRAGWRMLAVFAATLAVGYGMARAFGQPTVFGLTYGGILGLLVGLTVAGDAPGRLALRCVWGVPVFLVALLCAIVVQPHRVLALVVAAVAVIVQLSAPAFFGEFGTDSGVMLFAGFLGGILVPLPISMMQYVVPIVVVAAITAAVVQVLLCRMSPATGLVHTERAFLTRTRYVVLRSTRLIAADNPTRATRKLRDEMVHLNEAAMLVDGHMASAGRVGQSAARLHRLVFDTELAAHALGRTVIQLRRQALPGDLRTLLLAAMADLDRGGRRHDTALPSTAALLAWLTEHEDDARDTEHERVVSTLYRFIAVLGDLHRASDAWTRDDDPATASADDEPFTTPIELVAGRLPGTNLLAGRVLAAGGMRRPWNAWSSPNPQMRIAAQMVITLMIAIPLGDALNGTRFYWAVIGALIVLSNTDSSHDRVRKIVKRVVGTLIGGLVGIGFADLLGVEHPLITVVLLCVALAVGAYSISAYYSVWAGCLTFALIQLYAFVGGLQDSVVVLRAEENALGAVIATLVALVVLPIATRTLLRHAQATHLHSLATFVRESGAALSGFSGADGTREQARAVDHAAHELHRFTRSLVGLPGSARREHAEGVRSLLSTAAVYAREMSGGSGDVVLTADQREQLLRVTSGLSDSIDGMAKTLSDNEKAPAAESAPPIFAEPWTRRADDIRRLQATLSVSPTTTRLRHALHYLGHLDDILGDFAARLGMPVQGSDYRTGAGSLGRELFALRAGQTTSGPVLSGGSGPRNCATAPKQVAGGGFSTYDAADRWIDGSVLGAAGHPIPGVVLTLTDRQGHQVSRATCRPDGTYRIDTPPSGHHVLIVSANGHRPMAVTVSAGATPQRQDITLLGPGELSGTVRRVDRGEPLTDATMTLTDGYGEVVGTTITAADGGYTFDNLTAGRYTLVARGEGMSATASTLTVPESAPLHFDVDLAPRALLTGLVSTEERPVPNAQVMVLDATGDPVAHTRTDDRGRYVVADLDIGRYTVVASGYPPVTSTVTVIGPEISHDVHIGYDEAIDRN